MLYFANPTTGTAPLMATGALGFIDTPRQGNHRPVGVIWCADNGCFSNNFDSNHWFRWLQANAHDAATCLFAIAPDVVGDAPATLERSKPWLPKIRALGYPAAFVAQDGQEHLPVPWDEFDVLFIGGAKKTPEWKLGAGARSLVAQAKARGMWVHCGRVASWKRILAMAAIGVDSCDSTYLKFGPAKNLPNVLHWMRLLHDQPALFKIEAS